MGKKKIVESWLGKFGLTKFISPGTFTNLSTLFSGTVLSAIIPISFSPLMSRIFTSEDYGILGLYLSISGLIGVLAYVHYPQAIMLTKKDDDARQIMWFSIGFCSVIALMSLIGIISFFIFSDWIRKSPLKTWLFLIPLSVFFNGVSTSITIWANRHQKYKILTSNRILQAFITVIIQISFGVYIRNETGLLMGLLVGQFISAFLLWMRFKKDDGTALKSPRYSSFRSIAMQYRKLLIYSTPSEFINNLINQTPIFLLQKFGGISFVGSYNFTQRLLGIPQQFLSSAIVEVFKQKASVAYNTTGNCQEIYTKTFKVLALMAIVPFTFIILFAPPVFTFVFGAEWHLAGEFAQFLGVLFFFRFIVSPLTYVYVIAGKLKEDFWLHIFFLIVTTMSFFVGDLFLGEKKYLILIYSIGYTSIYLIYLLRSYQLSKGISSINEK
ncbi:MAG: lipopolysaccharide biosynthesis protein [Agriterribacter sp.]